MATSPTPYNGTDRSLKAYVRYDGNNIIVPSSLVKRRSMPKNGHWVEIPISVCCSTTNTPT